MQGTIKSIQVEGQYGFIKNNKADYFFHRSDFDGHWDDLVSDYEKERVIEVEFEPTRTDKGLRATEVFRLDRGI